MKIITGWIAKGTERFRSSSEIRRRVITRLVLILVLLTLYLAFFRTLTDRIGPVYAVLLFIPVAVTGYIGGAYAGLLAGVTGILLNSLAFSIVAGGVWYDWLLDLWLVDLLLILAGFSAGLLGETVLARMRRKVDLRLRTDLTGFADLITASILDARGGGLSFEPLLAHLRRLFRADGVYLTQVQMPGEQVSLLTADRQTPAAFSGRVFTPAEAAATLAALRSGEPLHIAELSRSEYRIDLPFLQGDGPASRSAVVIPLAEKARALGAAVVTYARSAAISGEELELARLAGRHTSLFLSISQQREREQQLEKERLAISHIGRQLSVSEPAGLSVMLQRIVDACLELIPAAKSAVLHLIDEHERLVPGAAAGSVEHSGPAVTMYVGEGVAGLAAATHKMLSIADTHSDDRYIGNRGGLRAMISSPIMIKERCLGTISIQGRQPHAFAAREEWILGEMSVQAGIAIANSRLMETTQRDLKEINILYTISRSLAGVLDPDALMKEVVDSLYENFGYYHVQIFVLDPQSNDLVMHHGSGEVGAAIKAENYRLPVGMGIMGHVAATGQPFFTNNVDEVIFYTDHPLLKNTRSELTVPIVVDGNVLGVLDIQEALPQSLSARDMDLMVTVADNLAVALHEARLYAELQTALNQEKSMHARLLQAERLAVAGRLLASVSHELNNPLQAIQNALFLLMDEKGLSAQGRQDLGIVISETERMAVLLERLRVTYRPIEKEKFVPLQINDIIEDMHTLVATALRHHQISFTFEADYNLPVISGSEDQLRQVILNLFVNAMDAMPKGGELRVATALVEEGSEALISISDSGDGIDPAILAEIFDPFITSKPGGTGLGLSITREIVARHGGRIAAWNNPEGGATFRVWLPVESGGEEE